MIDDFNTDLLFELLSLEEYEGIIQEANIEADQVGAPRKKIKDLEIY